MKKILTLVFICHAVSAAKHSIKFLFTGISGTTNFPEFASVATINEEEVAHCDSINRRVETTQPCARIVLDSNQRLSDIVSNECLSHPEYFKIQMEVFKRSLNQTEGSHVLQGISGCEWDDKSGEIKTFEKWGYEGEDFISLDQQTMTWITSKAEAVAIKHLWDEDTTRLELIKDYYMIKCPKLLQEYNNCAGTVNHRTERPSVSLLQKTPSSPVSCHATGFYPEKADLFWRKDGEEIHEGVEKGEILPNNDGTFQMSSELNVSLVQHEDWRTYDCVFQLYGVKEDIITTLNKAKIRTNTVSPSEFPVGPVVGGVAAVVLLLVLTGVFYCCWRKRNDFHLVHDDQGKEVDDSANE
ncbi:zinc-alpha-2-glycoprotein-like isoform X2 [Oryzias melastigma]|uniref:zinc-alpha-2-glycoprotein-like isoform X2 n=1 Tax=Oryzias melastigma TaxID=30732 RepID=UPI000CF7E731|nr:zinc-alpha-2-glycoprotein-like isoform X2 [Oryzias melastigma]